MTKQPTKTLSDSVPLADTISKTQSKSTSLTDSVSLSESIAIIRSKTVSLSDSLSVIDSVTGKSNLATNQDLVENGQKSIVVNSATPQLIVVSNNIALANVTIPSTVTNPVIDYSAVKQTSGSTISVQITNSLTINRNTNDTKPEVKIIIPATTITGTSWNGVLDLPSIQSNTSVSPPTTSGETATTKLVIKLGSSTPLNFDQPVKLVLTGQAGSRIGFFYDPKVVTEITSTCTSNSGSGIPTGAKECKIDVDSDLVIWTKHFTGFATWSSSSSGGTSTASSVSSTGGGTGVGVSAASTSYGVSAASTSYGGGAGPYLKIQKISYDTCDKQIVRIQVATDVNETDPMVIVRTSIAGVANAELVPNQPYAQENINATVRKLVYEAHINPKETSFEVVVLESINHNIFSVGKTIEIIGCSEELDFTKIELPTQPAETDLTAPKIFDLKFQIGNGTKQLASNPTTAFVDNKPLSVYAIAGTPTPITYSKLRLAGIGDTSGQYHDITMNVVPLPISNSTYLLSATITPRLLQAPGVSYWVHIENSANKKVDSDIATIGVKPSYPILGDLQLDTKIVRVQGITGHPTAYFTNNSTGPVYGHVVLLVNGTVAYASPSQIFNTGQNVVNLQWKTGTVDKISNYQVQARAEIFGKTIDTVSHNVTTFPGTVSLPLSKISSVGDILLGNSTIAKASTLYSSFNNDGTMRYKVTAHDGTCVIGPSDNCLVTKSTLELAGNFKTVTIGDQVYRVRYTGPDDVLERFSITSIDSLSGNWKVEIDFTNGLMPAVHAMDNIVLKVKYRAVDTPFISEHP
jgi:hypothetical protein